MSIFLGPAVLSTRFPRGPLKLFTPRLTTLICGSLFDSQKPTRKLRAGGLL